MKLLNIEKMNSKKLYDYHLKISDRQSVLCQICIDNGLGYYTFEDMKKIKSPADFVVEYLELAEEQAKIKSEAERRFGPDGLFHMRYWRGK